MTTGSVRPGPRYTSTDELVPHSILGSVDDYTRAHSRSTATRHVSDGELGGRGIYMYVEGEEEKEEDFIQSEGIVLAVFTRVTLRQCPVYSLAHLLFTCLPLTPSNRSSSSSIARHLPQQ